MSGPFTDDEKELIADALREMQSRYSTLTAVFYDGQKKKDKEAGRKWVERFVKKVDEIIKKL